MNWNQPPQLDFKTQIKFEDRENGEITFEFQVKNAQRLSFWKLASHSVAKLVFSSSDALVSLKTIHFLQTLPCWPHLDHLQFFRRQFEITCNGQFHLEILHYFLFKHLVWNYFVHVSPRESTLSLASTLHFPTLSFSLSPTPLSRISKPLKPISAYCRAAAQILTL